MLKIYSAAVCPFAQRTRALLTHLGAAFELHEVDLANRDPELLRLSPTGKVPFFQEDDFILYESAVINEYLAKRLGFEEAFSDDLRLEARQRLAMKRWDEEIAPAAFYHALQDGDRFGEEQRRSVVRELEQLARTAAQMNGQVLSLLAFHLAPFYARMVWLRAHAPGARLIENEQPGLKLWLDQTLELHGVAETLPDREATVESYLRHYVRS